MTAQELNTTVIAINRIIASNNPVVAVTALKNYGYQTQFDVLPADQIEKALFNLYTTKPDVYFNVIRQIPYRANITNWTTSRETKQNIINIANQIGATSRGTNNIGAGGGTGQTFGDLDVSGWWNTIITSIGGSAVTKGDIITTTTKPLISTTTIVIISVIAFLAIIFLLWESGIFKRGGASA